MIISRIDFTPLPQNKDKRYNTRVQEVNVKGYYHKVQCELFYFTSVTNKFF